MNREKTATNEHDPHVFYVIQTNDCFCGIRMWQSEETHDSACCSLESMERVEAEDPLRVTNLRHAKQVTMHTTMRLQCPSGNEEVSAVEWAGEASFQNQYPGLLITPSKGTKINRNSP